MELAQNAMVLQYCRTSALTSSCSEHRLQPDPEPAPSPFAQLDAARKREAATREVLDLISRSRDDAGPVFDAILRRAADLCNAHAAALAMGHAGDTHQQMAAHYGVSPATVAVYDRAEVSMNPEISLAARAILTGQTIHIPDMMDTDGYRNGIGHYVSVVRDTGVRSQLFVPLMTALGGIGCLIVFRTVVQPFTPDEIALVETFASQAVIAIENVRQFRELQTRLEREAATREILEVISQSRDDEAPVFDMILRNAAQLCKAPIAVLLLVDATGVQLVQAASHGETGRSQQLV